MRVGTRDVVNVDDGESDLRSARIRTFLIDPYAVTNRWFSQFVDETDYRTEAERFGWSFVFEGFLAGQNDGGAIAEARWWRRVNGANWRRPFGPLSCIDDSLDHPVVHVSWNDACAFAQWSGGRLPSEVEWTCAARGGLPDPRFPWGDEDPTDRGPFRCNIWQGTFPHVNTGADGFLATAPVDAFEPNGYGLYNMSGNVWEWCEDRFRVRTLRKAGRARDRELRSKPLHVIKGGSYLCHRSYCYRYRISARSGNTAESSTGHMGFRVVWDDPGRNDGPEIPSAQRRF